MRGTLPFYMRCFRIISCTRANVFVVAKVHCGICISDMQSLLLTDIVTIVFEQGALRLRHFDALDAMSR